MDPHSILVRRKHCLFSGHVCEVLYIEAIDRRFGCYGLANRYRSLPICTSSLALGLSAFSVRSERLVLIATLTKGQRV